MQRKLSEANSALQKQWRELSGSFEDQLRHLELECSTKLEQAAQQVQLMSQTAAEREAEAQQAHSKERAAADKAAVSVCFVLITWLMHYSGCDASCPCIHACAHCLAVTSCHAATVSSKSQLMSHPLEAFHCVFTSASHTQWWLNLSILWLR